MDVRVETRGWRHRTLAPVLLVTALGLLNVPDPAEAKERFDQTLAGIAIGGYDTVAYFTVGKAMKGSEKFSYDWLGATWHFANAKHRDLFMAEPVNYVPQYGGYCTSGIVNSDAHRADPKIWRIIDGKLYLNGSDYALKTWADKGPDGIAKTDAKWEQLEAKLTR